MVNRTGVRDYIVESENRKMENSIQIFENSSLGTVRTVMIKDEIWFVGKDVATILGYKNQNRDITRHVEEEDRINLTSETQYHFGIELGQRGGWLINESGLYSLILSSKLPTAKEFKKWITSEVIPSIRKHGAYVTDDLLTQMLADPTTYIKTLQALADEKKAKEEALRIAQEKQLVIEEQQAEIEEMKPKSIYCDKILKCSNLTVVRDIAKDYGYSSQKFNILLKDFGIQYKTQGKSGKWCPTAKYQDKGIMKSETYDINNNYAKVTYKWTQQGRLFLYEFLKERGILPVCERMELEQLEEA